MVRIYSFNNNDIYIFLQAPVGPLYFTGEHTSAPFNGYVHGAYLAGNILCFQSIVLENNNLYALL